MKSSASALIVHNRKVLLLLRDNISTITDPNKWSLPGGEIEEGETEEQAIMRELYEEINANPSEITYLGKIKLEAEHSFFQVSLNDNEVNQLKLGNEGQEYRFFIIDEISKLDLTINLSKYFSRIKNHLKEIVEEGKAPNPKLLGLS